MFNLATTLAPICTTTPSTSFEASLVMPPQCSKYTLDTDGTRSLNYREVLGINRCDSIWPSDNQTVWFRFQSPAGTMIVNYTVPSNRCGTICGGWYAGQYPSTGYTIATSIACFVGGAGPCHWCNLVSITNCDGFFVFALTKPPECPLRYCTM